MLPRVTITPDLSGRTLHSGKHFSKPASDHNRSNRKPIRATFVPTSSSRQSATKVLTNATPTRRSFEKPPLEPGALASGIQPCLLGGDSACNSPDVQQQALSNATVSQHSSSASTPASSAASLHRSDSELALLLDGADLSSPGTTTINIGSIPIQVPLAYVEVASAECEEQPSATEQQQQQQAPEADLATADVTSQQAAAAQRAPSKLSATSAEFYPPTYIAAAATALASAAVANSSTGSSELPSSPPPAAASNDDSHQPAELLPDQQQAVQQQSWQAGDPAWQQWQLQWQQWQQQQPMPAPIPMFFPVPAPVPPFLVPAYPYAYHEAMQHQQHMQVHPIMLHHQQQQQQLLSSAAAAATEDTAPATPATSVAGSNYTATSPTPRLPADTSSLMSTPTAAGAGWTLAHSSSLYGGSSSRPGSSASSIASGFTSVRSRQQHQALREAGTVTVSAVSCVKDAAGALAKVVSRHSNCLLLSLSRAADEAALATHVAAKTLAVARFYVNARMAAGGAAGVEAAAVLTGLELQTPTAAAAVMPAGDEVVFMPYHRSGGSSRSAADTEPALGFIVAKADAKDLPVVLPPPVGIPACMQDKQQQQQHRSSSSSAVAAASTSAASAGAPLLKAGANTDVNKLSNAIIHNILGCNHVALQLAGAAACHVAMKALIKARARLQRKFHADIIATASFANEDTSSSIGRSTVFLRLDVMRSSLWQQLAAVGSAVAGAIEGASAAAGGQQYAPDKQQQSLGVFATHWV